MNRRKFLFDTMGAVAIASPLLAKASTQPCPPPLVKSPTQQATANCGVSGTVLSDAAASLSAGQSVKLATTLPASTLIYSSEGANFIQWGNSGWYDAGRKECGFIGKRDASYPYHWLVYNETANTWSNTRAVWSTGATNGHGYDQSAFDPATGTVYHRPYNDSNVRAWDGASWSSLTAITGSTEVIGGLTWFPGVGLTYNDGNGLWIYAAGAWTKPLSTSTGSYSNFSEYNSTSTTMIFGGGSGGQYRKMTAARVISTIASPPFVLGAGKSDGLCVSDPRSASFICYDRGTGAWARYDVTGNSWVSLSQASGNGSTPTTGTPNFTGVGQDNYVISIEVPAYGVMMFVQYVGGGNGNVWLYKHTGP